MAALAAPVAEEIASATSGVAESAAASSTTPAPASVAAPSSATTPTAASSTPPTTPAEAPSSMSNLSEATKNAQPSTSGTSGTSSAGPQLPSSSAQPLPLYPSPTKGTSSTDFSKPPPVITRGTTLSNAGPNSSSYPGFNSSSSLLAGVRNHFNQSATSSSNGVATDKSASTSGLLSNILLGPRLTVSPTVNFGSNGSQNQHQITNVGSPLSSK